MRTHTYITEVWDTFRDSAVSLVMSSEVASSEEVHKTPEVQLPIPAEIPMSMAAKPEHRGIIPSDLEMTHPNVRLWISKIREAVRPWSDFFKTSHFEIPKSPRRLGKRVIGNLKHFQSNYVIVFLVLSLYCFITDPLLIVAAVAYLITCWILKGPYT